LFGDYNPGGRLSQTFYKSENQLPDRFDYDIINGGWTYQYFDGDVQYPFGHGLSYTEFTYSNLMVSPDVLSASDTVTVEFDVRNTGDVAGDEVAQVYLRDAQASVKVANKQLRGFKRITLNAGQSQHLTFDIPVSELGYYDEFQEDFIVEGGIFDVLVGSSSQDIRLQDNFVVRPSVDVDNSGLVDVDDLMRIVLEWLSDAACYTTDMCNGADLDGSGFVDLGDMVVLSHHWLEYQ
jgi:beta-glucosidase